MSNIRPAFKHFAAGGHQTFFDIDIRPLVILNRHLRNCDLCKEHLCSVLDIEAVSPRSPQAKGNDDNNPGKGMLSINPEIDIVKYNTVE